MTNKSSKKISKKRASKSHSPKSAKGILPSFPLDAAKGVRNSKVSTRYKRNPEGITRVWGSAEDFEPISYRRVPRLPNPWPPSDITTLLTIAATSASLAPFTYKFISAWIEDRKARKIRIKRGEYEVEIHGAVSEKELRRVFNQFRKLTKELDDERPRITLPRGVDRSFSLDLMTKEEEKKGGGKK